MLLNKTNVKYSYVQPIALGSQFFSTVTVRSSPEKRQLSNYTYIQYMTYVEVKL